MVQGFIKYISAFRSRTPYEMSRICLLGYCRLNVYNVFHEWLRWIKIKKQSIQNI